jgi:putative membrane protein
MSEETPSRVDRGPEPARGRTDLAAYQTSLALDRTMLSWVSTTLAMASFGFGMVAFFRTLQENSPGQRSSRLHEGAIRMGTALVLLGIIATVLAALSHWSALRRLHRGEVPVLRRWPLSLTVAALAVVIGLGGLWALFAL